MTKAAEVRAWITGGVVSLAILMGVLMWGRRIMALLVILWLIILPGKAFAECRFVTIQNANGTYTTCQVCDHIVNCF